MKKTISLILSTMAIASLTACGKASKVNDVFANTEQLYMFSAISTASLLSNQVAELTQELGDGTSNSIPIALEDVEKYVKLAESYLGTSNGMDLEEEISDNPDYQTKLTLVSQDLSGNQLSYTLYYNEDVLLSDANADEEDEEDEDNDENETSISGLLIVGETNYNIRGKKESGDEEKIEVEAFMDPLNYVKVTTKIEENERKFEYELNNNGFLTQTEVKIEEEDDELKLEVSIQDDVSQSEFTYKKEMENNQEVIKIEYRFIQGDVEENGTIVVVASIDPLTNQTFYSYYQEDDDGDYVEIEEDDEENETQDA